MKKYDNYLDWLDKVSKDDNPEFLQVGRVLATQFIAIRKSDNIVVGAVNVRHSLTDNLRIHGGHVGDCVRKSERGKGYGTQVLKDLVNKYKNEYDLIYCFVDSDNEGAIKLYKKLGTVYDEDGPNDNGQYYVTFYDKNRD